MKANLVLISVVWVLFMFSDLSIAELIFILSSDNEYYELHANCDNEQDLSSCEGLLLPLPLFLNSLSIPVTGIQINYQNHTLYAESSPSGVGMTLILHGNIEIIQLVHGS